jgi:hypothetical protein
MKNLFMGVVLALTAVVSYAKPVMFDDVARQGIPGRMVLHDDRRGCPEGALYLKWQSEDLKTEVQGCWKMVMTPQGPTLLVEDETGMNGMLDPSSFKEVQNI